MKYVSLPYNKKLNLLREHCAGCDWPDLDQEQWCLHCSKKFTGHAARVWQDTAGALWLECGTPGCDGSPIDWAPFPWWDPDYSENKQNKNQKKAKRRRPKKSGEDDVPF
jgi:hypothetical protein